VIFLRSDANTPKKLTWRIKFFDGDEKTLDVPLIRLTELPVKEIAERNLTENNLLDLAQSFCA
jgi:hypothetical protein